MKINKIRINKRPISLGKRKASGDFVIGGYRVQSPLQKPITKEGGETYINAPFRRPLQRTEEGIERERQKEIEKRERRKEELNELKYHSAIEKERARIQEFKGRQRKAKKAGRGKWGKNVRSFWQ